MSSAYRVGQADELLHPCGGGRQPHGPPSRPGIKPYATLAEPRSNRCGPSVESCLARGNRLKGADRMSPCIRRRPWTSCTVHAMQRALWRKVAHMNPEEFAACRCPASECRGYDIQGAQDRTALSETFNNREIAVATWAAVLFAWAMTQGSIRASLKNVIRAFFHRRIQGVLALMAAYIALLVYGLSEADLWNAGQLKNTIIWAVSVAAVLLFRLPSISEDADYFKQALKDNLKLIVVLEFIVSFYTFSMLTELIIVPVTALFGGMLAVAGTDKKCVAAEKFLIRSRCSSAPRLSRMPCTTS